MPMPAGMPPKPAASQSQPQAVRPPQQQVAPAQQGYNYKPPQQAFNLPAPVQQQIYTPPVQVQQPAFKPIEPVYTPPVQQQLNVQPAYTPQQSQYDLNLLVSGFEQSFNHFLPAGSSSKLPLVPFSHRKNGNRTLTLKCHQIAKSSSVTSCNPWLIDGPDHLLKMSRLIPVAPPLWSASMTTTSATLTESWATHASTPFWSPTAFLWA